MQAIAWWCALMMPQYCDAETPGPMEPARQSGLASSWLWLKQEIQLVRVRAGFGPRYEEDEFGNRVYVGPAYVGQRYKPFGGPLTLRVWLEREALILCVRAGMGQDLVNRYFDSRSPLLVSEFHSGPVGWVDPGPVRRDYSRLGVAVYWPKRPLRSHLSYDRILGGIE